jgi:uncharacterized protein YegL
MKKGLTEIVFVLDKSGSMQSIKDDAIGGFNSFIEEQRKVEGETKMSLVLFDDGVHTMYDGADIGTVEGLTAHTFVPSGMTALLDAIGLSIDNLGKRLSITTEAERPENVIIAIMTDGQENMSREYTKQRINEMVSHQTKEYNWQFIFLGANIDSVATAKSFGISADYAGSFVAKGQGASNAMLRTSEMVTSYRTMGVMDSYADVSKSKEDVVEDVVNLVKNVEEKKEKAETKTKPKTTTKKATEKKEDE